MSSSVPEGLRPGGRFADWRPATPGYVVADVDGTLVGPGGAASPVVVDAAHDLVASGIAVGYATGRPVDGVRRLHEQLGLPGPHIVLNGAQVRLDGQPLATWRLTVPERLALLEYCAAEDLYAELYLDEGFVVTAYDERFKPHWDHIIGQPRGLVADLDVTTAPIVKATVVAIGDEQRDQVVAGLRGLGLVPGAATSPQTPGMTYVNVTRPGVHKGTAVTRAAEHLGVGLRSVVAVGDGTNDLDLFAVAGTAVAMGQADEEVVAAAHLVAPEVSEDGAAAALHAVACLRG